MQLSVIYWMFMCAEWSLSCIGLVCVMIWNRTYYRRIEKWREKVNWNRGRPGFRSEGCERFSVVWLGKLMKNIDRLTFTYTRVNHQRLFQGFCEVRLIYFDRVEHLFLPFPRFNLLKVICQPTNVNIFTLYAVFNFLMAAISIVPYVKTWISSNPSLFTVR